VQLSSIKSGEQNQIINQEVLLGHLALLIKPVGLLAGKERCLIMLA
jgi:hypothetical protein